MKIFGFEIKREADEVEPLTSFAEPINDDGAITVSGNAMGGFYSTILDMEGTAKTESELVSRYRALAMHPEIAQAVDEIVNESISVDIDDKVVELLLDDVDLPGKVKDKLQEEFDSIMSLFDFTSQGYDMFSKFYVDGRINYHVIIDNENIKDGIKELRYVDPRKLKLIREMDKKDKDPHSGIPVKKTKAEYYMYSENGFGGNKGTMQSGTQGFKIAKDSIARVTSGLMSENNALVLSYLHGAIKPLNQLRMLEDATIIYTITRAPERRVFYIDVGNLPKSKAEQYIKDMMVRHKNKLQYNSSTGEVTDSRKMMTMTEDFWFPRRGGERTTEVDTMPGGSAAGLTDDQNLQYFQRKLFKALKVPLSRLEPETMYSFGRVSEITRDEMKFGKFVKRVRSRFSTLFTQVLEKQLVLKGIMTPEEFMEIKNDLRYDFIQDNYFEELKEAEIQRERLTTLRDVEDAIGVYYSRDWVRKNVLRMTEDEIKDMKKEIESESKEEAELAAAQEPEDDSEPEQEQEASANNING